jgi:hypothetical protein
MNIKGNCKDCLFIKQDWTLEWKKDKRGDIQLQLVLDTYCFLCDIFKSPDGYCDCWEPK